MKKIIVGIFAVLSVSIFASQVKMDEGILNNIRETAYNIYDNGSDAENYIEWQVKSYNKMYSKLNESNLTELQKQEVLKNLKAMYGNNYVEQNSSINREIQEISKENNKILEKENQAKIVIKKIREEDRIEKNLLEKIMKNAQKKYPNNYEKQQCYLEGFIDNYNLIKK